MDAPQRSTDRDLESELSRPRWPGMELTVVILLICLPQFSNPVYDMPLGYPSGLLYFIAGDFDLRFLGGGPVWPLAVLVTAFACARIFRPRSLYFLGSILCAAGIHIQAQIQFPFAMGWAFLLVPILLTWFPKYRNQPAILMRLYGTVFLTLWLQPLVGGILAYFLEPETMASLGWKTLSSFIFLGLGYGLYSSRGKGKSPMPVFRQQGSRELSLLIVGIFLVIILGMDEFSPRMSDMWLWQQIPNLSLICLGVYLAGYLFFVREEWQKSPTKPWSASIYILCVLLVVGLTFELSWIGLYGRISDIVGEYSGDPKVFIAGIHASVLSIFLSALLSLFWLRQYPQVKFVTWIRIPWIALALAGMMLEIWFKENTGLITGGWSYLFEVLLLFSLFGIFMGAFHILIRQKKGYHAFIALFLAAPVALSLFEGLPGVILGSSQPVPMFIAGLLLIGLLIGNIGRWLPEHDENE